MQKFELVSFEKVFQEIVPYSKYCRTLLQICVQLELYTYYNIQYDLNMLHCQIMQLWAHSFVFSSNLSFVF